ncbi:MAG: hypothetical protein V3S21_09620 [Xanthomonadales bacterium]
MTEFNETFDLDVLRRKAKYLEVIHEFALSQVDLNSLDEILWNVAKTAIAKLGFVDCVIYLLDEDGTTLIHTGIARVKSISRCASRVLPNLLAVLAGQVEEVRCAHGRFRSRESARAMAQHDSGTL